MHADLLRVGVAQFDHLLRRRFDRIEHVAMRGAGVKLHVRDHRDIAAAHRFDRHRSHPRQKRRGGVAVERLRIFFVEVDEHRAFLTGLVVLRQRENALQLVTATRHVVKQHATSPAILSLLRIGVRELLAIGEVGARQHEIGKLRERLPSKQELLGIGGALRRAERRVIEDQRCQRSIDQTREAGLFGVLTVCAQREWLGEIDLAQHACPTTLRRVDRRRAHVAIDDLVATAGTVGKVARDARAVERQQPQVETMFDDDAGSIAGVSRDTIRRVRPRMIVFGIRKVRCGRAAEHPRCACCQIVRLPLAVIPVQEARPVGRNAADMLTSELSFEHQRAFTRRAVHPIEIRRRALVVGHIRTHVTPNRPDTVVGEFQFAHGRVGKQNKFLRRDIEAAAKRTIAILFDLDHLLRLNPLVLRPPHIDIRHGIGAPSTCGVGQRHLRDCAEVHARAIVAPSERRAIADEESLWKRDGARGREQRRRASGRRERRVHIAEYEQRVVAFAHLLDVASFQDRERVLAIVPREAAVAQRIIVEHRRAPVREFDDEESVAIAHGRIDGVAEQVTVAIE